MDCEKNAYIAPYTSWQVGGNVSYLLKPGDIASVQLWLREHKDIPVMMLGLGSNLLFADGDVEMAVILSRFCMQHCEASVSGTWLVDAGVSCAKLARLAAISGYRDAAFFCGIPGTIGGALAMNAGAYGGETWNYVDWVDVLFRDGRLDRLYPQDITVGYRKVILPEQGFFVRAQLSFTEYYPESQQAIIAQWLSKRSQSQPIGLPSCGSVFKNPYPQYAGFLIESCGLKGFRVQGAEVSHKHANFIINRGGARARDIEDIISHVQNCVAEQYGIILHTEVVRIG